MTAKSKFKSLIKLASLPLKELEGKSGRRVRGCYSDKRTRQRKTANTSGKRRGKSRE